MTKEKSKSKPRKFPIAAMLVAAVCVLMLLCIVTAIQSVVWPLVYHSKPMPGSFPSVTEGSYLSTWSSSLLDDDMKEDNRWTDSFPVLQYRNSEWIGNANLFAWVKFAYYDTAYFSRLDYSYHMGHYYPWGQEDFTPLSFESLAANDFKSGCVWNDTSCTYVARYGLCLVEVTSQIHEPDVTLDDFKHLIIDSVDTRMADFDLCYQA